MNGVGSDFRQKDCEIRESKLEVSQLIHKPLRYSTFGLSVTYVRNGDPALCIKEFVVFEVRRKEHICSRTDGIREQKTACSAAQCHRLNRLFRRICVANDRCIEC